MKINWELEFWKLVENWNFGKLFENRIFIKIKYLKLKYEELKGPNTWPFGWCIEGCPCIAMIQKTEECIKGAAMQAGQAGSWGIMHNPRLCTVDGPSWRWSSFVSTIRRFPTLLCSPFTLLILGSSLWQALLVLLFGVLRWC